MMVESISDLILSSAEEVLGTMFFTPVFGRLKPDSPGSGDPECGGGVRLCFLGGTHSDISAPGGHLDLEVSCAAAQLIASNFLAVEGTVSAYRVDDVLCELANVICGNIMSTLASENGFAMLSPEMVRKRQEQWPRTQVFEEKLELEQGWLMLRLGLIQ
jgi:hypothetical protein